jgi:hypothetical protein
VGRRPGLRGSCAAVWGTRIQHPQDGTELCAPAHARVFQDGGLLGPTGCWVPRASVDKNLFLYGAGYPGSAVQLSKSNRHTHSSALHPPDSIPQGRPVEHLGFKLGFHQGHGQRGESGEAEVLGSPLSLFNVRQL